MTDAPNAAAATVDPAQNASGMRPAIRLGDSRFWKITIAVYISLAAAFITFRITSEIAQRRALFSTVADATPHLVEYCETHGLRPHIFGGAYEYWRKVELWVTLHDASGHGSAMLEFQMFPSGFGAELSAVLLKHEVDIGKWSSPVDITEEFLNGAAAAPASYATLPLTSRTERPPVADNRLKAHAEPALLNTFAVCFVLLVIVSLTMWAWSLKLSPRLLWRQKRPAWIAGVALTVVIGLLFYGWRVHATDWHDRAPGYRTMATALRLLLISGLVIFAGYMHSVYRSYCRLAARSDRSQRGWRWARPAAVGAGLAVASGLPLLAACTVLQLFTSAPAAMKIGWLFVFLMPLGTFLFMAGILLKVRRVFGAYGETEPVWCRPLIVWLVLGLLVPAAACMAIIGEWADIFGPGYGLQ